MPCLRFRGFAVLLLGFSSLALASGCGQVASDGPDRFHVSGSVTFDGRPVPHGTIVFEPDVAAGNQGPQGYATIQDGKFDTRNEGKGVVGGQHKVRLDGLESLGTGASAKVLFENYQQSADLSRESATLEIQVPASAASTGPPVEPA